MYAALCIFAFSWGAVWLGRAVIYEVSSFISFPQIKIRSKPLDLIQFPGNINDIGMYYITTTRMHSTKSGCEKLQDKHSFFPYI